MINNQYPKLSESLESAEAKFPELLAKSYPRILTRLELVWGNKEASDYLNSIFLGDSDGRTNRQGFPVEILKEIVYLKEMHDFLFPSLSVDPFDPFSGYLSHAPTMGNTEHHPNSADTPGASTTSAPHQDQASPEHHHEEKHIDWPLIYTQRELAERSELWHAGTNIYPVQGKPIEEVLVHYDLLDERALRVIHRMQERAENRGKSIDRVILDAGLIRHDDMARALCVQAGILMVDIMNITIPFKILKIIPDLVTREKQAVPVGIINNILFLAVADPIHFNDHQTLSALTGLRIVPMFAPRHEIVNRINMYK